MQIEDGRIIGWLWWAVTAVLGGIVFLLGFIYSADKKQMNADRARIKTLEEKMSQAATMPQVKELVDEVKEEFKGDHTTILIAIGDSHEQTREYIRDMFDAREGKWNGRNRRKN